MLSDADDATVDDHRRGGAGADTELRHVPGAADGLGPGGAGGRVEEAEGRVSLGLVVVVVVVVMVAIAVEHGRVVVVVVGVVVVVVVVHREDGLAAAARRHAGRVADVAARHLDGGGEAVAAPAVLGAADDGRAARRRLIVAYDALGGFPPLSVSAGWGNALEGEERGIGHRGGSTGLLTRCLSSLILASLVGREVML